MHYVINLKKIKKPLVIPTITVNRLHKLPLDSDVGIIIITVQVEL